nr:unnamed protein product [Callosobruchus analis]
MSGKGKPPDVEKKCEVCEVDIRRGSAKVKCSNVSCEVTLHQKYFSSIAKVIKLEKNEWLCKNCNDEESDTSVTTIVTSGEEDLVKELATVKSDVRLLTDLVNELKSSNNILLNKIEELSSSKFFDVSAIRNNQPPLSYSHVVSKNVHTQPKSILIITSKDGKESSVDVSNTVKANVNPATEKIGINGTRLIKNGMLISCSNDESLEKLKATVEAKFSSKYKISTPKHMKPRLLISDVDKALNNERDFLASVPQYNDYLDNCDIKVITVLKQKYSLSYVVEVDPDVRKQIMSRGYLFTPWRKCYVRDHISVIRCFKCFRFGHFKKDCKNKSACSLCSDEHDDKVCESAIKKCVNCCAYNDYMKNKTKNYKAVPVDHASTDNQCPCFLRKLAELKSRIDYG